MLFFLPLVDPIPSDKDVVAGPWGFVIFAFLVLAVAFLGWSFRKQLKKANAAAEAGLYDPSEPKQRPSIPLAKDLEEPDSPVQ